MIIRFFYRLASEWQCGAGSSGKVLSVDSCMPFYLGRIGVEQSRAHSNAMNFDGTLGWPDATLAKSALQRVCRPCEVNPAGFVSSLQCMHRCSARVARFIDFLFVFIFGRFCADLVCVLFHVCPWFVSRLSIGNYISHAMYLRQCCSILVSICTCEWMSARAPNTCRRTASAKT